MHDFGVEVQGNPLNALYQFVRYGVSGLKWKLLDLWQFSLCAGWWDWPAKDINGQLGSEPQLQSFGCSTNFLLPLRIDMGINASKSDHLLKVTGIVILLAMCLISTIQLDSGYRKKKSSISCDGDAGETIIVAHERQRTREFLDTLKKMTFTASPLRRDGSVFCELNPVGPKSLFVNAYQRNVFYVFALSTVP